MNFYFILSVLATIFAFVAVYMLAIPLRKGYFVALASHSCWIVYSVGTKQYMVGIQSLVLMGIAIKGYLNWKYKNIG